MSEPKFTPAPWDVISDPLHYDTMTTVVGGKISQEKHPRCQMLVQVGGYADLAELEANAHLIAAAPELFGVLLEMVEMIDSGDEHGSGSDWHKAAKAALAKARGES